MGQKLDPHGLSDDEQSLIDASPSPLPHGQSWIMFTPTDLLGQYLKEAFSRNNVPAPDLRIKTWIGHRKELARNHLSILRTANGGGPFILKDSAATITPDAVQSPIEWFEQFQTKQNSDFWSGLEGAAAISSSATDAEIAKLGDRLRAAVQSAQTTSAASGIYALVSLSEDVRRVLGRVRADVDGVLKTALARAQAGARTQGENFSSSLSPFSTPWMIRQIRPTTISMTRKRKRRIVRRTSRLRRNGPIMRPCGCRRVQRHVAGQRVPAARWFSTGLVIEA